MIRAIIIDCFGVLYIDNMVVLRQMIPPASLSQLEDLRKANDYGYIERHQYLEEIAQLTGKTPADIDRLSRTGMVRNNALLKALEPLHKTYKVALLSNVGTDFFYDLFSANEAAHYFDETILSSDIGLIKPDPALFQLAADRLEVRPDECVMIDDSLANVEGAQVIGMHALVFSSNEQVLSELDQVLHA